MASENGDNENEYSYQEDADVSDNFEVSQAELDDSTNGLGEAGDEAIETEIEGAEAIEADDDPVILKD